jgi:hypothetical protein
MFLSNVLITSSEEDGAAALPPLMEENVNSFRTLHPEIEYRLFRNADVLELLEKRFPPIVMESYRAMRPFAYQADLARYCILYEHGGLYADLSYFFLSPVPCPDRKPTVFRGKLISSPWDTSNGIIFAPPRHKALACAIQLVCANVKRRYYGLNALCPTGPALLGKAFATTCDPEDLRTGSAKLLPRARVERLAPDLAIPPEELIHCQIYRETLIAVKRKRLRSPGLTDFGVTTGNSYADLWNEGAIYA